MSEGSNILNEFEKSHVAKDAFVAKYDPNATLVNKSEAHEELFFKSDGALHKGAGAVVEAGKEGYALGKQAYGTVKSHTWDSIAKEGYVGQYGDESSEIVDDGYHVPKQGIELAYGGYQATSTAVNTPAKFRNWRISRLEAKSQKLIIGSEKKLNKSYRLQGLALDPNISKAKKTRLENRSDRALASARRKAGIANNKIEKASQKKIKNTKRKALRSVFDGSKLGFLKVLGIFAGIGLVVAGIAIVVTLLLSMVMMLVQSTSNNSNVSSVEAYTAIYLRSKGYSDEAIAGIMGNMANEGGWITSREEISGGGGYGLFQFTGGQRTNFMDYCSANNINPTDAKSQLDWVFANPNGDTIYGYSIYVGYYDGLIGTGGWNGDYYYSAEELKSGNDTVVACVSFMAGYERCAAGATANLTNRINSALQYYSAIKNGSIFNSVSANANDTVSRAYAEIGKPYVWGAVGPDSYDCSGLVSYCLTGQYVRLGTTTTFMGWERVDNPQPGDICTSDHHCGIYIGGGQMIHAPDFGETVKIGNVQSDMIYVRYSG